MELIFNARQLSRCPELPAGNGNYARWQKFTASSSEQWRNSCLQDGKTLEGLQARPDPVYEPMSVSLIFRLGQKESRWTPAAGIQRDSILSIFNALVSNFKKNFALCTFTKSGFQHRWLQPSESLCPHILLHLPPSMFRCQNHTISHEGLVSSPQLPYNK